MNFEVGQWVGDYEILQMVGAGGMGRVYKVRNVISQRTEAMKVLLADLESQPDLMNRFLREIRVVATLRHRHIAGLLTAQRHGTGVLMLMDFVEGESLDKIMRRQRIPLADVVRYAQQMLDALDYAHKNGVVHRDIKPANILITPAGDAVLTDFGIAVAGRDVRLTQAGHTLGSLFYMSPEQISGTQEIDGRADLYSLGIMIYEMATGQRAIDGPSDFSVLTAHVSYVPKPPSDLDPAIPQMLSRCIMKALAKDRSERFQSAAEMRVAMDRVFDPPANAEPSAAIRSPSPSGGRPVQPETAIASEPAPEVQTGRKRLRWLLAGAVAAVLVLVAVASQLSFIRGGAKDSSQTGAEETRLPVAPPPPPPPPPSTSPIASQTAVPSPARPADQSKPDEGRQSPAATHALIQIDTEPPGANVSVDDGAQTCTAPCAVELTAGRHAIRASRAGFRDALNMVEIPRDAQVTLKLSQRTGSLAVRSDPTDAQIFVNGQAQPQRTPAILHLPVGKYKILLKKQGQPDYEDEVEVVDQVTRTMEVTWQK